MDGQRALIQVNSFPILPPPLRLHGHRLRRNHGVVPRQVAAKSHRAEDGKAIGRRLLGAFCGDTFRWIRELYT